MTDSKNDSSLPWREFPKTETHIFFLPSPLPGTWTAVQTRRGHVYNRSTMLKLVSIFATAGTFLLFLQQSKNGVVSVSALSTGAAGCGSTDGDGEAAVEGMHLTNENGVQQYDDFQARNLQFSINDIPINPSSSSRPLLQPNGIYEMKLTALQQSQPFKGALIRVEHDGNDDDYDETLSSFQLTSFSSNAQSAEACTLPVIGITHKDSKPKLEMSATFMFAPNTANDDAERTISIDITVVDYNNSTGSLFGHQQFTVGVATTDVADTTTSPAPTAAPKIQTLEPTVTNAPSSRTAAPTYDTKCYICGYSDFEVDNTANVVLGNTLVSCAELLDVGAKGLVDPDFCNLVQQQAAKDCGCRAAPDAIKTNNGNTTISPAPPTPAARPTQASAPTSAGVRLATTGTAAAALSVMFAAVVPLTTCLA